MSNNNEIIVNPPCALDRFLQTISIRINADISTLEMPALLKEIRNSVKFFEEPMVDPRSKKIAQVGDGQVQNHSTYTDDKKRCILDLSIDDNKKRRLDDIPNPFDFEDKIKHELALILDRELSRIENIISTTKGYGHD